MAAHMAPMMPAIFRYIATSRYTSSFSAMKSISKINVPIKNAIGKATNMGWSGWLLTCALLFISNPLLLVHKKIAPRGQILAHTFYNWYNIFKFMPLQYLYLT